MQTAVAASGYNFSSRASHGDATTDFSQATRLRLTDERLAHILERPEMKQMGDEHVLRQPQFCRRSRSDEAVRLFYEFYQQTMVGGKWLCIVIKYV
jgi:hypothetical protein